MNNYLQSVRHLNPYLWKSMSMNEKWNIVQKLDRMYLQESGETIRMAIDKIMPAPFEGFFEGLPSMVLQIDDDEQVINQICDYLFYNANAFDYNKWLKRSLQEKADWLYELEVSIAALEHRPAVTFLHINQLDNNVLGYQQGNELYISLDLVNKSQNNIHAFYEVMETLLHEGRHRYQFYNIGERLVHRKLAEAYSWKENVEVVGYQNGMPIYILIDKFAYTNEKLTQLGYLTYYYQPLELDARNFSKEVVYRCIKKMIEIPEICNSIRPQGEIINCPNGDQYVGEVDRNGQIQGRGTYFWKNGDVYEGEWNKGKMEGAGIIFTSVGTDKQRFYMGGFQKGKPNGYGKLIAKNGNTWIGYFVDDSFVEGTILFPNGDYYIGQMNKIGFNGHGTYYWKDGNYYSGEWLNGKKNGRAKEYYPQKGYYDGIWNNDTLIHGCWINENGDYYIGKFKNNQAEDDNGAYYWQTGEKYVGSWKNGQRNGYGTMWNKDGNKYSGIWKDDVFLK